MSFDESYSRRIGVITRFGNYIKAVIDDQGIETALEYSRKAAHSYCDNHVKNFVATESPFTMQEARERLQKGNPKAGINGSVVVVGDEVRSRNGKCVFYDGWSAAGLKPSEIEQLCSARVVEASPATIRLSCTKNTPNRDKKVTIRYRIPATLA